MNDVCAFDKFADHFFLQSADKNENSAIHGMIKYGRVIIN